MTWAVLSLSSWAYGFEPLQLDSHTGEVNLSPVYLGVYEDTEAALSIRDVLTKGNEYFSPVENDIINLGHSSSSVWATFTVIDNDPQHLSETPWLLEIGYPQLKRVNIYVVADQKVVQEYNIGYGLPMEQRELPHRLFVQPILLEPQVEYQVYVNVMRKNGSIQLPLKLYRPSIFLQHELSNNYIFGMLFGIMGAMIIYNLYLCLSVGSRAYFYYILYIASAMISFLMTTGYGYYFIWPRYPVLNEYMLQLPTCVGVITGMLFVRHFIDVKRYYIFLDRLISWIVYVGFGLILFRLLTPYFLSETITLYVGAMSIVMPVMTYMCWRKGSRPAGFFLLGWAMLFVGVFLYTLSLLAVLPSNSITNNAVFVGAAMETLLLSLGLADRINSERKQKYSALQSQHETVLRLQEAEQRLMHRALHSGITGLPNRTFLKTQIEMLVSSALQTQFSVVLLNLNNFHEFNKTLGHSNGDAILYLATQRMNAACEKEGKVVALERHSAGVHFLAGVEGVTFALMLSDCGVPEAQQVALRLLRDLERPFEYQGLALDIDATASMACYPEHGTNSENLIRNAHIALEAAESSNEKLAVYSQQIDPYNERRISLLGELRHAIESDQLQLYFQPQISLKTNKVEGAEVLIRWIHPEYGFIPPDEFIPLAERTGVIHALTYWICRHAFQIKSNLTRQGFDIALSINISARNLQDAEFSQKIQLLADEENISLQDIVMELTETAVMTDPDHALKMMSELNEAGIRLSIDDFGTGYSSLSYLKRLPVNEIKIDRSFVMDMATSGDDQLLVRTTLSMGHNLSLVVVAEGIEDAPTLDLLKAMGCDLAQGYHIARPMPVDAFYKWLGDYVAVLPDIDTDSSGSACLDG
ncbi:EAL domain-containing protein [Ketobacter sp.]